MRAPLPLDVPQLAVERSQLGASLLEHLTTAPQWNNSVPRTMMPRWTNR
jgi:hypothetical protein